MSPHGKRTDASASGIGLESALLFAQEGAHVALVDVNEQAVQKTHKLIGERFPNVKSIPVKADVSKEAEVKNMVDETVKTFGRLDVMVSSATLLSSSC